MVVFVFVVFGFRCRRRETKSGMTGGRPHTIRLNTSRFHILGKGDELIQADLDGLERVRLNRVWPKFSSDPALRSL